MQGELRKRLEESIKEVFASDSVKPEDLEDEILDTVENFTNDMERTFQNIKDSLDKFDTMQAAYDLAEDYADKLY